MKDILVIGGSYFVGRVFVEELLKRKEYRVTVLNRGSIPIGRSEVREIACDRHDTHRMGELLPSLQWHGIVDFCAYTPGDVAGTLTMLPGRAFGRYIFISTASVYAPTMSFPVGEGAPMLTGPQPELGPFADYAYDKCRTEQELQRRCGERGLSCTIIRPAFIYGKYNYAPRENYFFDLIEKDRTIVLPENSLALFSFVSVWDVARIIIGCLETDSTLNRAFNASAEELVSYPRLMEVLGTVTGKNLEIKTMSTGEIEAQGIPLPFPLSEHLIYAGTLIQSVIDFSYTPFLEGMGETYRFYRLGRGLSWPPPSGRSTKRDG
jgi:2'-hydroxyisoflavone reductase